MSEREECCNDGGLFLIKRPKINDVLGNIERKACLGGCGVFRVVLTVHSTCREIERERNGRGRGCKTER